MAVNGFAQQKELGILQQRAALEAELERLAVELQLDKDRFAEIRKSVEGVLLVCATDLATQLSVRDKTKCKDYRGILGRDLADAVHLAVQPHVDLDAYAAYRSDYEKAVAWVDLYAQKHVLIFLDTFLQLNAIQFAELEQRLNANWDPAWNDKAFQVSFYGHRVCKQVLDALEDHETHPNQITELLTGKQKVIFRKLGTLGSGYSRLVNLSADQEAELLGPELKYFLDRAIEEFSEVIEMDQSSKTRLQIGFKGARLEVLKERKAARKTDQPASALWKSSALMIWPQQQMREEKIWQNAVARILPEQQRQAYFKDVKRRSDFRDDTGVVFGIMYLNRVRRLKYHELTKLHQDAVEEVKQAGETNLYRTTFVLFSQPDEFFKDAFDEETFKALEPKLTTARLWER